MLCAPGFWGAGRFFFCGGFLISSVSLISKRNVWKRDSNNFMGATSCGVSPTDTFIITRGLDIFKMVYSTKYKQWVSAELTKYTIKRTA